MKAVLVIGAGKIGGMITDLLASTGDYRVTVADRDETQLSRIHASSLVKRLPLDISDDAALERALAGQFAVLSAAPYHLTTRVAEAAKSAGVSRSMPSVRMSAGRTRAPKA